MKVGIIGTGYVGLVTGVVLASRGFEVVCLDKDAAVIDKLKSGRSHIYEKGIDQILVANVHAERLFFELAEVEHLSDCRIIFICVDTPTVNGLTDFTGFKQAAALAAEAIRQASTFVSVVVKSTVLPGTTFGIAKELIEQVSGKAHGEFGLGANPEFLREGSAIQDFIETDRIVLGVEDKATEKNLLELYRSWNCDKMVVNTNTAEFVKYMNNSLFALLISFGNEMANISYTDPRIKFRDVLNSINADKRLNPVIESLGRVNPEVLSYLVPGPGYGGSCFPKDIKAFSAFAETNGVVPHMLQSIQQTNDEQPAQIIGLIQKQIPALTGKKILVLGFSHKPNTDDSRHSVTIAVINKLVENGALVTLHDPVSIEAAKRIFANRPQVQYTDNWADSLPATDVIVVLTAWKEYLALSESRFSKHIAGKVIADPRLVFANDTFTSAIYVSY